MTKVFRLGRLKMTERGSGHQICRLSFVVCRLSFVVCRLSFVVCRLSFVIILQIPKKDE